VVTIKAGIKCAAECSTAFARYADGVERRNDSSNYDCRQQANSEEQQQPIRRSRQPSLMAAA
jgi:hypothetical protein